MLIETDEKYKFVLERMGYCLGKWVYLCDVADDLKKDIKKGNFNPLTKELPKGTDPIKFAEQRLTPIMNNCFIECSTYSELLEIKKYKPILDNILYEGLKHLHTIHIGPFLVHKVEIVLSALPEVLLNDGFDGFL